MARVPASLGLAPAQTYDLDTIDDPDPFGSAPAPQAAAPPAPPAAPAPVAPGQTIEDEDPFGAATKPQTRAEAYTAAAAKGPILTTGLMLSGAGRAMLMRGIADTRDQLAVMDRIDHGERVSMMDDPIGYASMDASQRADARAQLQEFLNTAVPPRVDVNVPLSPPQPVWAGPGEEAKPSPPGQPIAEVPYGPRGAPAVRLPGFNMAPPSEAGGEPAPVLTGEHQANVAGASAVRPIGLGDMQRGLPAPPLPLPETALTRAGAALTEYGERTFPIAPERESFGTRATQMVTGMAPIVLGAGLATAAGQPEVGAGIVASTIFAQSYDSTFRDAQAHGATPEQADRAALENAAMQGTLMVTPVFRALDALPAPLRDGALRTLVNMGRHGVEFAGFNSLGTFLDNYVAKNTYEPERPLTQGIGEAGAEGFVAGMAIPVGAAFARTLRTAFQPMPTIPPRTPRSPPGAAPAEEPQPGAPPGLPGPGAPAAGGAAPSAAPPPRPQRRQRPAAAPPTPGSAEDLAAAVAAGAPAPTAAAPAETPVPPTVPEPAADIHAQIAALADPKNPKDAVFLAAGTPLPRLPVIDGLHIASRPEGIFLATDAAKADQFRSAPTVTDPLMARLLGYPETKGEAVASGNPVVVQGTDAAGAVVAETLASPQAVPAAEATVKAETPPGGAVAVRPPEAVAGERTEETAAEGAQPPAPAPPTRIRTVEQIMREDGIGAKAAAAKQTEEIAAIGRPITMDEMAARRAGVAALPSSVPGVPPLQPSEPRDQGYPMFTPAELTIDPAVMQFKASDERGVTGALSGHSTWEPALANPITVWQTNDGRNVVVNGHQRLDLAQRAEAAGQQGVQLPARVYREADGYTPEYMRALGAYQNIAEGSGTPLDAARVLRTKNAFPDSMRLPELPPHQMIVQQARGLAQLSPEAFGAVENGIVPPEYAGMVGAVIAEPAEQMAALDALARGQPANANQARIMIADIRNGGFLQGAQTTLFGEEAFARSLVPERAKVLDAAMKILRSAAAAFRATVKGEETLTAAGNILAGKANVEGKTASERLLDTIGRNATTVGPYSDALNVAARQLAAGKQGDVGKIAHSFLAAARELERGGTRPGVSAGAYGHGVGPAPEGEAGPIAAAVQGGMLEAVGRLAQPPIKDERQGRLFLETPATMPKATGRLAEQGVVIGSEAEDFARFAEQNPGVSPAVLAGRYVLERGRETGHEYLTAYDPHLDAVVMAHTTGSARSVDFPPGFGDIATDPSRALVFQHNHPNNSSLSSNDVYQLSLSGVSGIVAQGHDGSLYAASLGPAVDRRAHTQSTIANAIMLGGIRAKGTVSDGLLLAIRRGEATNKELEPVLWDTINRALHGAGFIDYVAVASRPPHVAAIADRVAQAAVRGGYNVGDHRHPDAASADEGIARILARSADDSRTRRSAGQERGGGGPGLSEGAPPHAPGGTQEVGVRGLAERKPPLPPASGAPLFGEAPRAPAQRPAPEPALRTDERQAVMPGMEPSAVQAQAARDQVGRGALLPTGEQKPANEGLFAPKPPEQKPLFGRRGVAPAAQVETPEFKSWFRNSAVVDETGRPLVVYHGTQRPDRVGGRFRSARATSGPMAFFTDDPAIASSYAASKSDTSLTNEDASYETWFRIKPKGARAAVPLDRAWWSMSPEQKAKISSLAPRVTYDDDRNIVMAPEGRLTGIGNYDYELKRAHGNAFKALIEGWLNGGVLYNDEEKFHDVLRAAGVDVPVEMHDPHATMPAVFPTFLSIQRPLDTSAIPQPLVAALDKASRRQRFDPRNGGGDIWDKNRRDPREWVRELLDDIETGKSSHAWTSIPDWVTKTLRAHGYDGIKDTGGKLGGQTHTVWIPFDDVQVKSATGNVGTFDPNNPRIAFQRGQMPGHPDYPHPHAIQAVIDAARAMTGGHIQIEAYDAAHHAFTVKFPDGHTEQVFGYAIGRLIRAAIEPGRFAQNMSHEVLHALKRLGVFTGKEWSTLEAAAERGNWIEKHGVRARYPELGHVGQLEEAIADETGVHLTGPAPPKGSLMARVIAKLRAFLARLRNMLARRGFQTAEDVFGRVQSGEVGAREPGSGMEPVGPQTVGESLEAARAWGLRDPTEIAAGRRPLSDRELAARVGRMREFAKTHPLAWVEQHGPEFHVVTPDFSQRSRAQQIAGRAIVRTFPVRDIAATDATKDAAATFARDYAAGLQRQITGEISEGLAFGRRPTDVPGPDDRPEAQPPIRTAEDMTTRLARIPHVGAALSTAAEKFGDLNDTVTMMITPMAARGASDEARAIAKQYANLTRWIAWDYNRIIDWGRNTFKPDRLKAMWDAADADSVAIQETGKPLEEGGVASLRPDEQAAVKAWQADAENALAQARKVGMTEAEGLPSYAPRMVVDMVEGVMHPFGQGGEGARAAVVRNMLTLPLATMRLRQAIAGRALIGQIKAAGARTGQATVREGGMPQDFRTFGTNLRTTTPQLIHRKHLTTEETEQAANRKRAMMDGQEFNWFTIKGNPAFWTVRPRFGTDAEGHFGPVKDADGNMIFERVPIYVRSDFEGPLKAILHESAAGVVGRAGEALYQGMMSLKGRMMTSIMYGVAHLGVIAGRAFPAAPNLVRVMRLGNAMKQDPATMRRLILGGMAPIGRTMGFRDLPGIIEDPQMAPGRSWTSKILAAVPGLFDPRAGAAVLRAVDRLGDFTHGTLLWDQVQNIQVGLALDFEQYLTDAGMPQTAATRIAANFANIYAGALPREAMSQAARAWANILLFSRSYRLGNLAAVKSAFLGLPRDVRSQLLREHGEAVAKLANSLARRKGISVLLMDMALYYIGNSLIQSGLNAMLGLGQEQEQLPAGASVWQRLGAEGQGYARRLVEEAQRLIEHPQQALNPFGVVESLSALYDHEPQKRNRILIGFDKDGTGIYMRNPTGKTAEDISDYFVRPLDTAKRMMSPFARPMWELATNDQGFGHKLYDPMADAPTEVAQAVGGLARSVTSSTFPWAARLAGAYEGREGLGRALGETAAAGLGTSVSKGYPGGPALGEMAAARESHEFSVQRAMPGIRDMIRRGDNEAAAAKMTELGIEPGMQRYIFGQTVQPTVSKRQLRDLMLYGTPEQQRRVFGPAAP
jgi:hypothetical protein